MEDENSYASQTYNVVRASLYAFPSFIILVALVIVVGRYIHSEIFVVMGWVIVCSAPFLFQKRYKNLFTRRIELEFNNQGFSTKEYTLTGDVLVKDASISWASIKSFKCYFSSDVTYLVLYLRNGSNKSISINDGKDQDEAINEKSVFSIFHYFVKQYNSNEELEKQIYITPGFLATKPGVFLLYGISALTVAAIILHIILKPDTSMFSFMGLFIVIGLLVKRKKDKDFYNKISQLEPRLPVN